DDLLSVLCHRRQCGDAPTPIFMLVRFIPHLPVFDLATSVSGNRQDKVIPILYISRWITRSTIVITLCSRMRGRPSRRSAKSVNYVHIVLLGSVEPSVECWPIENPWRGIKIVPSGVGVPQSHAAEGNRGPGHPGEKLRLDMH